jgi:kinesin family protein 20
VSLDNNLGNKILNVKRNTISWENSLEDVVEDEDLVEDLENAEDKLNVETEHIDEDLDKTLEDDKAFSSQENRVCIKNSYFYAWLIFPKSRVSSS